MFGLFKKPEPPKVVEPLKDLPVRPCWCGSLEFTRSERFYDTRACADCGAIYADYGMARKPCGL